MRGHSRRVLTYKPRKGKEIQETLRLLIVLIVLGRFKILDTTLSMSVPQETEKRRAGDPFGGFQWLISEGLGLCSCVVPRRMLSVVGHIGEC